MEIGEAIGPHQKLAANQRRGETPTICPHCGAGTLIEPENPEEDKELGVKPDLVCDKCGRPYWHWRC